MRTTTTIQTQTKHHNKHQHRPLPPAPPPLHHRQKRGPSSTSCRRALPRASASIIDIVLCMCRLCYAGMLQLNEVTLVANLPVRLRRLRLKVSEVFMSSHGHKVGMVVGYGAVVAALAGNNIIVWMDLSPLFLANSHPPPLLFVFKNETIIDYP